MDKVSKYFAAVFSQFLQILGHCRKLQPIFKTIAQKYRGHKDLLFARLDLGTYTPMDLKVSFFFFFDEKNVMILILYFYDF